MSAGGEPKSKAKMVADILCAAGEAFGKLSELVMDLHPEEELLRTGSFTSGTKWTDAEVRRLHEAMALFNNDLAKISNVVRTRSIAQVRAKLRKDNMQTAAASATSARATAGQTSGGQSSTASASASHPIAGAVAAASTTSQAPLSSSGGATASFSGGSNAKTSKTSPIPQAASALSSASVLPADFSAPMGPAVAALLGGSQAQSTSSVAALSSSSSAAAVIAASTTTTSSPAMSVPSAADAVLTTSSALGSSAPGPPSSTIPLAADGAATETTLADDPARDVTLSSIMEMEAAGPVSLESKSEGLPPSVRSAILGDLPLPVPTGPAVSFSSLLSSMDELPGGTDASGILTSGAPIPLLPEMIPPVQSFSNPSPLASTLEPLAKLLRVESPDAQAALAMDSAAQAGAAALSGEVVAASGAAVPASSMPHV